MMFAHRLALALGEPRVEAMLARLTARELATWMAYYRAEPWGAEVEDARHGTLMALLYNLWRGRRPAKKPAHFMLTPPRAPRQSPRTVADILTATAQLFTRK